MSDCYYDASGCLVCPELPAVAYSPARVDTNPNIGWTSGADSIATLAGDVFVLDTLDALPIGIVIGFKTIRAHNVDPAQILHGLYFYAVANAAWTQVLEQGDAIGQPVPVPLGTPWAIRRIDDQVTYWLGNALLARTAARSMSPLFVNACLYAAGDEIS